MCGDSTARALARRSDVLPSVCISDRPVIGEGHLLALDNPKVRAVAEKYGDPSELLREELGAQSGDGNLEASGPPDSKRL